MQGYEVINRSTIFFNDSIQGKMEGGSTLTKSLFYMAIQYKLHWFGLGYDTPILNR